MEFLKANFLSESPNKLQTIEHMKNNRISSPNAN